MGAGNIISLAAPVPMAIQARSSTVYGLTSQRVKWLEYSCDRRINKLNAWRDHLKSRDFHSHEKLWIVESRLISSIRESFCDHSNHSANWSPWMRKPPKTRSASWQSSNAMIWRPKCLAKHKRPDRIFLVLQLLAVTDLRLATPARQS